MAANIALPQRYRKNRILRPLQKGMMVKSAVHETHQRHEKQRVPFVALVYFVDTTIPDPLNTAFRRGLIL